MKIAACLVLFVLLGVGVNGQQSVGGKIFAESSAMSERIVKGSPFTADAVSESVQMLADGNRIVRSSTNRIYRNSEGRFRRDISGGSGGTLASFYSVGPGITILDPVAGQRYLLDSHLKTARIGTLRGVSGFGVGTTRVAPAADAAAADKVRAELRAASPVAVLTTRDPKTDEENAKSYGDAVRVYADSVVAGQNGTFVFKSSKYETRTEQLGIQNIEGVEAEGTRTITTIPAGDIGNERPIEMISERWYSKDLQLVVMSRHSDPRFGEQTYRLTNIVKSEPDPSLFELPAGYKVLSEPAAAYTISTSNGKSTVWANTSGSGTGVTVRSTKP